MATKHTPGTKAAAWEITDLIDIGFVTQHRNKKHETIEAIITKHKTPAEKAAPTLQVRIEELEAEKAELVEALQEIAKREGAFSRDHLTHANNTIENMAGIAEAAIAKAQP